jgi:hypothetical protein
VRESGLDLKAARTPCPGLAHHGHELVTSLDDPLRFDAEVVKALHPAAEEALETVAATMRSPLWARRGLMPLDVRVE